MTAAGDGWCRSNDCPGYLRPDPLHDPEHLDRAPRGTKKHVAKTGNLRLPIEMDEVDDVRISQTARDSFRFRHGGSDRAAEVQLRNMLEDFVHRSARRSRKGYVILAREGYELILDEELHVVTGYQTTHKERTWDQVKAGVATRYGRKERAARQPPPEPGKPVAPSELSRQMRPETIHLTARVRNSFARTFDLRAATEDDLDAKIRRRLLEGLPSAMLGPRSDEYAIELVTSDLVWLVRPDGLVMIGVKRSR